MDLFNLITQLREDGTIARLARRPLAQFGTPQRRLIGAEILPEREVMENAFRDDNIRYRSVIANSGTRYSPVQLKQGVLVGSALIELGESDLGSELSSRDYDALIRYMENNRSLDATAQLLNFLDITVNRGLIDYNEKQRWQALVARVVQRRGDNGYVEDVTLPQPAGHILYAADAWSDVAVDPFDEINAACQVLRDKGFEPRRIVTRSQVSAIMTANPNVKTRTGRVTINSGGDLIGLGGRSTLADINAQLQADNNPPIEVYDTRYQTQTGSGPFLEDGAMVIIASTDRQEEIVIDNNEIEVMEGTLGYTAIGRAAGQAEPGRVLIAEHMERKPPRVEAEGWQTSFPVIQEPEAYLSIRNIHVGTP
jgi:hypothetical protein